ncbi:hypothetical protein Mpop_1874 [Methylorubrum populi BJ001]|jgi:hypothetical protein|uniref:Uncharacterized protein n=1 Tax=Methylorubrum populi (strain ATCC BAA-705 / NCIMB 13946 / BJ001) TaxID=441620 RepID=B1ZJD4_METPB|nr:hypothetical protein Mpop_1874 [Methylorubrum populi BJ001]
MSTAAIAVVSCCALVGWCATLAAACAVVSIVVEGRS